MAGTYTKYEYEREQGDQTEITRLRGLAARDIAAARGLRPEDITITAHPPMDAPGQAVPNPRDRLVQVDYTWA